MSTATLHTITPDELRSILQVRVAVARLADKLAEMPESELRERLTADTLKQLAAGKCLRGQMTLPDQARHDLRVELAVLARLNGWLVPDGWECPMNGVGEPER